MPVTPTENVSAARLRSELTALGMDNRGSRSDLVNRLQQGGVYEINTCVPPKPAKVDRTTTFPNHSSVLLGNGAMLHEKDDNKLVIKNSCFLNPLISGDFKKGKLEFGECSKLRETSDFGAQIEGEEGDIRRNGSEMYMYRETDVHPGWYPLLFGSIVFC